MTSPWWKLNKTLDKENFSDWQELRTEDGLTYYFNRVTQETTWDKPSELMTDEEKTSTSNYVWVPDETNVYLPGLKLDEQSNQIIVELDNGEVKCVLKSRAMYFERYVNKKDAIPMKKSSLQRIVSDLTLLDEMSTPLILHCLRKRFEAGKIYSAIGTILISINPYTQLDLYTPKMIRKYRNSLEEHREVPPHVFVVADQAYKGLTFESGPNQSIVISGESGAGKTEAAKQCLSYLGAVAGSVAGVEKKVFDANPILEGFGNAKTVRNNNSSRFGKYVDIYMNQHLQLMGGKTQNYLLEKVRVGKQSEGERNYHIFYMITKGADRSLRQSLDLGQPEQYRYCTQGNCTTVAGINDKSDFDEVKSAFKTLEFSDKDVSSIYRVLAGILHIGNTEYEVVKSNYSDDTSKVTNKSSSALKSAAKCWGVNPKELEKGLTHKALVMPGNRTVEKGLNPENAKDQRDALCKFVYDKIFDWLVVQINKSMEPKKKVYKSIGILDIFGFEIFQVNSLEQLCINFCNEKLQQLFNFTVFKQEEKVYKSEQIGFDHVPFIDNQPILDLIEKKPKGIMPLLDEEGKTPGGSDKNYRKKLSGVHGSHKNFRNYPRNDQAFVLTHYAGDVIYDTHKFMEKNKDELDRGLLMMLDKAKEHMIKVLFPKNISSMSSGKRKMTLSAQFRKQLSSLMVTLNRTQPHYIRCIKPNDEKAALTFVPRNCFEQMTYAGVFEAVKIRKGGFPFRLKHSEFANRYRCILEEMNKSCGQGKKGCMDIVRALNMNKQNIREGKTMMLYRAGEHKILELKRNIIMEKRKMNDTLKELINTNPEKLDEPELYYERLARTIRACKRYNIDNELSRKAKDLLDKYIEARIDPTTKNLLNEAIEEKNLEKLERVCIIIEREQYETDKCILALRMRDRIHLINDESEKAVVTLETAHMEACLFAAQELEYTNDYIDYFRWMFETLGKNSEKFVQEQMRQAVKMHDLKRQIRLNIKLKDLFFDKAGSMFAILNCPVLKELRDWAGEKLNPFGKDKLKEGFMKFTTEEIHTSLSTIDKKKKQECKDLLKLLQGYMMDRTVANNNYDGEGLKILTKGYQNKEFRNEIYLQLVKQLTNNPKQQSINRGWNMMTLCLYTFPPSQELENYLEVFVRNQTQEIKDRCLVALQSIIYSNSQQRRQPTLRDMQDILAGSRPVRRDFMEEPPEVPSWAILTKPFKEMGVEDDLFGGPELAGSVAPAPKLANNKRVKPKLQAPQQKGGPPPFIPSNKQNSSNKSNINKTNTSNNGPPKFVPPNPMMNKSSNNNKNNNSNNSGPPKFVPPSGSSYKPQTTNTTNTKTNIKSNTKSNNTVNELRNKFNQNKFNQNKFNQNKNKNTNTNTKSSNEPPKFVAPKSSPKPKKGPPPKKDEYEYMCHLDQESGDVFYENIKTGETTWDRPNGKIKPFWLAHMDNDSGELYFENIDSGETTWDKPDEFCDPEETYMARKDPESGDYFYENLKSGETTWDVPSVFQEKAPEQEWLRHFDPNSGDYYYENCRTGETTWDPPKGVQFE